MADVHKVHLHRSVFLFHSVLIHVCSKDTSVTGLRRIAFSFGKKLGNKKRHSQGQDGKRRTKTHRGDVRVACSLMVTVLRNNNLGCITVVASNSVSGTSTTCICHHYSPATNDRSIFSPGEGGQHEQKNSFD